ncbi:MAG: hypothetical protein ACRDQZ_09040 [Mycobacteriales bacterium]
MTDIAYLDYVPADVVLDSSDFFVGWARRPSSEKFREILDACWLWRSRSKLIGWWGL